MLLRNRKTILAGFLDPQEIQSCQKSDTFIESANSFRLLILQLTVNYCNQGQVFYPLHSRRVEKKALTDVVCFHTRIRS